MNASEKARIAGRKKAVAAGKTKGLDDKESSKRFYVQTRVAELKKAGKPVTAEKRKQLREKFNSGDVSRRGFGKTIMNNDMGGITGKGSKKPDFKVGGSYRSGRTIQGATGTKARVSRAGAAREALGSKSGGRASTPGGFGKTMPKKSTAGRGKGGEMMGSNKSSSAQAGKYPSTKKASPRGSKY